MVLELDRFNAEDESGRRYVISEIAAFVQVGGALLLDGAPTLLASPGGEAVPTDAPGEYRIPRLKVTVREVGRCEKAEAPILASQPIVQHSPPPRIATG